MNIPIILASASPARRELLRSAGFSVTVMPTGIEEHSAYTEPELVASDLASQKLSHLLATDPGVRDSLILACDTVVSFQDHILGKPSGRSDARKMLQLLKGQTHTVYSAASLYLPGTAEVHRLLGKCEVTFYDLTESEIDWYITTGEYDGAAGSYRIQGQGIRLVKALTGDYYSIVGLPLLDISGIVRSQRP